jgi:chorismate mutase / prephenate dehydratase
MTLDEIRKKINTIDFELLKLLNTRMEYALRTTTLKKGITDSKREDQVLDYIQTHSQGLIKPEFCRNLFLQVIRESKRLQGDNLRLIGFQGEHGSFSEVAAMAYNPDLFCISCNSVGEIFRGVGNEFFDYGIVPVESSLGGTVMEVNEFLADPEFDVQIVAEIRFPISYSLLTLPDVDPEDIRVVYSSSTTLSHCSEDIRSSRFEARPFYGTAASAKMLQKDRPEASAAIASRFCADYYNLKVVREGIEDNSGNMTRFLVVSRSVKQDSGDKCSVVFMTEHRAGALVEILGDFAEAGMNLTRIESMPKRNDPGNYQFFLDFVGSPDDPAVKDILESVERKTATFKLLGCYNSA